MSSQFQEGGGFKWKPVEGDSAMDDPWSVLNTWLMMNVGSKEAMQCVKIVETIVALETYCACVADRAKDK